MAFLQMTIMLCFSTSTVHLQTTTEYSHLLEGNIESDDVTASIINGTEPSLNNTGIYEDTNKTESPGFTTDEDMYLKPCMNDAECDGLFCLDPAENSSNDTNSSAVCQCHQDDANKSVYIRSEKKCHPKVNLREACLYDEQCATTHSFLDLICRKRKCACNVAEGYKEINETCVFPSKRHSDGVEKNVGAAWKMLIICIGIALFGIIAFSLIFSRACRDTKPSKNSFSPAYAEATKEKSTEITATSLRPESSNL